MTSRRKSTRTPEEPVRARTGCPWLAACLACSGTLQLHAGAYLPAYRESPGYVIVVTGTRVGMRTKNGRKWRTLPKIARKCVLGGEEGEHARAGEWRVEAKNKKREDGHGECVTGGVTRPLQV